jgi:PAS domain S-box-containing protein
MISKDPSLPRILLVEDSDIDAELICTQLDRAGLQYRLLRAVRKAEFVAAIERDDIDLILADYSLPDFDGLAALAMAQQFLPDVPVVFVSGVGGEELATDALRRGATDYVVKRNLSRLPGSVARALSENHERSQRRQVELALVKSEANMRLALDAASLGLWQCRDDGAMAWDARCCSMLGLDPAEPASHADWLGRAHPADRAALEAAIGTALDPASDGALAHECRFYGGDGSLRCIVLRGSRLAPASGDVRMVGVLQDVSATRALESRQRHSELMFRMAAQATGLGVWEIGPGREDLWFDDAYRRMAGLSEAFENDLMRLVTEIVHPDDRERVVIALERAMRRDGDGEIEIEHRMLREDTGELRWVVLKGRRVVGLDGLLRLVGTVRDVTEQNRLQQILVESNEELERRVADRTRELTSEIAERGRVEDTLRQMQRLEAVGQLTSGVAHDFNNLLTVVLSNISLIGRLLQQQPAPDARIAKRLESMRDAATRGATLTRQLLAFSRRQRLEPQTVSFNEIVLGMRDLLQTTLGGSVHLETALAEPLWFARVDPTQMELIILNLAINARDAMEVGGSLRVRTSNVTRSQPPARPDERDAGDYVVLSVSDTGTGMSDEVLAKAFEPFFTTKEVGKGSGLGLAQVFGFAKQSGGGVTIETHIGAGTTLNVFMPRSAADAEAARPAAAPAAPPAVGAGLGRTLLLVDDDSAVREATASLLQLHGYEVAEAGDAAAALQHLRQRSDIDLVLADFAMPRMNGSELAAIIQRHHPGLPVLFMTGFADLSALGHVPENLVLLKPVEEGQLVARLQETLQRRGGTRSVAAGA